MFRQAIRVRKLAARTSTYLPPLNGARVRTIISEHTHHHLQHHRLVLIFTVTATRYTKDHEYVKYDDTTQIGSVHITEYAQESLGDVVFVELPAKGTRVAQAGRRRTDSSCYYFELIRRTNWCRGERQGSFGYCEIPLHDSRLYQTSLILPVRTDLWRNH
jgi:hypothetical protein